MTQHLGTGALGVLVLLGGSLWWCIRANPIPTLSRQWVSLLHRSTPPVLIYARRSQAPLVLCVTWTPNPHHQLARVLALILQPFPSDGFCLLST